MKYSSALLFFPSLFLSVKTLRKPLGLCLIFLFFSSNLYTQTKERGPIFQKLEFRAGAGGFWQNNSPRIAPLTEYRHELYTGATSLGWSLHLDIELNNQLGFSTGFKSSSASFTADLDGQGIWQYAIYPYLRTVGFDMEGWEVPMSLRLYFLRKKRIRPYLDLSVGINRMNYVKRTGEYVDPQESSENYFYSLDEETQWNLSYAGGAGVYMNITDKISFAIDLKYQRAELYYFHTNDELHTTDNPPRGRIIEFAILRPVASAGVYFEIMEAKRKE